MAKATRICRVCGKEYEYCKTWVSNNKFRYQDVACSPECGAKYFAMIEASRSGKKIEPKAEVKEEPVVKKSNSTIKRETIQNTEKKPKKRYIGKSVDLDV